MQSEWPHKRPSRGENPLRLQVCPSLEEMGLKYRRWFRSRESNEMPALVAMVHLMSERDRKINVWVEKSICDGERVHIGSMQLSASVLRSLGLLRLFNGVEPPIQVVRDVVRVFKAALSLRDTRLCPWETVVHLSPVTYSCIFQRLRKFSLSFDIDHGMLFEVLAHFGCLEDMTMETLSLPSSQPHLRLLRTLKRLELGTTSLLWMEGCTFTRLEKLIIRKIADGCDRFRRVQMPVCRSASIPQSIPSELLRAFEMPQLHNLDLHLRYWRPEIGLPYMQPERGFVCPSIQQFRLHTASFCFVALRHCEPPWYCNQTWRYWK